MGLENNSSRLSPNYRMLQHGGNIEQEAKRLGVHINSLIDASASLVPFSLPPSIYHCLVNALKGNELKIYPDRNHLVLREAIGKYHEIQPSMILPGNGASELITWAARDAAKNGVSLLPSPGFSDYQRAIECWNGQYQYSPLPLQWSSTFPQPFPLKPNKEVIWITNPHNPTGQFWNRCSLEELLKTHSLVICDEAFLPLVPQGEQQSLIPLVNDYPNLIVLRSLTKLFSIAGLRLGYAISSISRIEQWQKWRDPWPVNGLAIAIGTKLMTEAHILNNHIKKVQDWVHQEGAWLQTNLQDLPGITCHSSSTNFQLIESNNSLVQFRESLARNNILLRDCRSFIGLGENWLRISLQSKSNNRQILKTMKHAIQYSFQ